MEAALAPEPGVGFGRITGDHVLHAHTGADGAWHVYPDDEGHTPSTDCVCQPFRTGRNTWLHWAKEANCGCE